jgi:hypothetical protein
MNPPNTLRPIKFYKVTSINRLSFQYLWLPKKNGGKNLIDQDPYNSRRKSCVQQNSRAKLKITCVCSVSSVQWMLVRITYP